MKSEKSKRVCARGHTYLKSSDCPTCPKCENLKAPESGFLSEISAPARRALERAGINAEKRLSTLTEQEILALHGIGPSSMPALRKALKRLKLTFKK